MGEYRKEGSTLEAIRLSVTIPNVTALDPEAIGTVLLLMTPYHYYGEGRTRGDTVEAEIGEESNGVGWTLADNVMTITHYPTDLDTGFYESEVWIYDSDDQLVLKTPSGRPLVTEVRESLARAPGESS